MRVCRFSRRRGRKGARPLPLDNGFSKPPEPIEGTGMTNDELITRLHRVEAQCKLLETLSMCVLPAIDPGRRPVVLQQFRQFCQGLEQRLATEGIEPAEASLELNQAADLYRKLEGTLEVIAEHEKRKKR